jgi:hypothetical protein
MNNNKETKVFLNILPIADLCHTAKLKARLQKSYKMTPTINNDKAKNSKVNKNKEYKEILKQFPSFPS